MTGSAGTAVDVLVTCFSYTGRRVWQEGGGKSAPICDFGALGHHFGDPEVLKDTQQNTLGTRRG